jgi:outer membrane protein assembly factor BamD
VKPPLVSLGLALAVPGLLLACAHGGEVDLATLASNSDQVIWEAAQKAAERRQWESARQLFKRIVEGFPQSEHGPAARLALGDSYMEEGGAANYILAAGAYRDFLTLYPTHARADYAQFRVAESHFSQRNGPDRDQTATEGALEEYQRLLEAYPGSIHAEPARQRIAACRQSLARSEFQVGYFYQRTRQACRAAIARYERVLSEYPDFEALDELLFRLGECLVASGRAAEAPPHLKRILDEFPQSAFRAGAEALLSRSSGPAPGPPPPAAPDAASPVPASPSPPSLK